ncbi:MAG TPA: hypothetical protein VFK80_02645, partial [Limnochordia bacterium]|nr:hypothetical protein [Limnochordia bacterium]
MVDRESAGLGFDPARAALLRRRFGWSSPTLEDGACIAERLGRPPRGVWAICRRCPCGAPQVIANAPLVQA